jgi:hypothetical protein
MPPAQFRDLQPNATRDNPQVAGARKFANLRLQPLLSDR